MEPKYRVARYIDVYPDEAKTPEEAAAIAYAHMRDEGGEAPILEVTDLHTDTVTDVDMEDSDDE